MRPLLFLLFALSSVLSMPAHAVTPLEASDRLRVFLDGFPDLGPGYAVVVVDRERPVLEYVRGQRNAASGAALTMDTPMYIASQTKAYMGLLAQILDRRGVLPLDSTLADHWPALQLPDGVDPAAWTLADLLNHRVPIEAEAITVLEAYVASPGPASYPQLLANFAAARAPGFQYDNLGYNIYAAILHARTGKPWQDWLREELFEPLGLQHTSARTSVFDPGEMAFSHIWLGEPEGWELVPPKADRIMQSAGGMMTSPSDMARWLQLHLGGEVPPDFDVAALAAAHRSGAEVDPKARNAYELPCDGYAFGWNICDFEGHRLYIHGGGYTGARTMMAFAPELGVGIGVFSNSDNMTGWLTSRTVVQFLQYLVEHPDAEKWAELRQKAYPERVHRFLDARHKQSTDARNAEAWKGWTWKPGVAALDSYVGRYRGERLPVDVEVSLLEQALLMRAGAMQRRLEPATPDLFGATWLRFDTAEPLRFLRGGDGVVIGFEYEGERYLRVSAP